MNFKIESRGFHHGQSDLTLILRIDNQVAGYIDFTDYEGEPSIQFIQILPGFERKGHATALLKELQKHYPDKEIDWGMLTNDGLGLYNNIRFKKIIDKDVSIKTELLSKLKKRASDLSSKLEIMMSLAKKPLSDEVAEQSNTMFSRLNRLNDKIQELERELRDKKVFKKIII